ncbi:MAG: hypothetical protein IJ587_11895, partial [Synergistaceae bacterium]|nr:hypothetical protein [Synergistaceae bacterium]
MKKLLALLVTVAMLSVVGSAMAFTLTASPVSIVEGRTGTATFTVSGTTETDSKDVDEYEFVSVTPASLDVKGSTNEDTGSTTLTFTTKSGDAGSYTFTVTVTHTYASGDVASHQSTETERGTGTVTVTVTKPTPSTPDTPVTPVTPTNPQDTTGNSETATKQSITVTEVIAAVKVISQAVANMPSLSSVVTRTTTTIAALAQPVIEASLRSSLARITGNSSVSNAPILTTNSLTATEGNVFKKGDNAGNLQRASAKMKAVSGGDVKRAIGVIEAFIAQETGLQPLEIPGFDRTLWGRVIGVFMNSNALEGTFAGAAAGGSNDVVFFNTSGDVVTTIPTAKDSDDSGGKIVAGKVTALAYVTKGQTFEPIITTDVTAAEAASFDKDTGSTTVASVELPIGTVEATVTKWFSPVVDAEAMAAIEKTLGASLDELPYTAASGDWTYTKTDYADANDFVSVVHLPPLYNVPDNTAAKPYYVATVKFGATPSGDVIGAPRFFPNDVLENGERAGSLYTVSGTTATLIGSNNAKSLIKSGNVAFLVFKVASNAVTATEDEEFEAAAANLLKPSVVVSAT